MVFPGKAGTIVRATKSKRISWVFVTPQVYKWSVNEQTTDTGVLFDSRHSCPRIKQVTVQGYVSSICRLCIIHEFIDNSLFTYSVISRRNWYRPRWVGRRLLDPPFLCLPLPGSWVCLRSGRVGEIVGRTPIRSYVTYCVHRDFPISASSSLLSFVCNLSSDFFVSDFLSLSSPFSVPRPWSLHEGD